MACRRTQASAAREYVVDKLRDVLASRTQGRQLDRQHREARFARIYDGPDEVHIHSVARRLLKTYRDGGVWSFSG